MPRNKRFSRASLFHSTRSAWRAPLIPIVLALFAASTIGCGKPINEEQCDQLLERYTNKIIDQARPSIGKGERRRLIEEARQKAALDPAFAECTHRVTRVAFDCAMEAGNADQIERCLL